MAVGTPQLASSEFTNPNLEVLYSEEQIKDRVAELGAQISADYIDKDLVLVSVLKGSCVFLADLMRAIDLPLTRTPESARPLARIVVSKASAGITP